MARSARTLAQMKASPLDWRIESLKNVADGFGLLWREPSGSHTVFRHPNGAKLSVPAKRPIKPIYVKKFVKLVEEGVGE
jgi:predicted RNA binding protein YcfA (HicA-like mRNA interferase family)